MNNLTTLPQRFSKKYRVNPATGCWDWTGAKCSGGYGNIMVSGKSTSAHRLSWRMHKAIPCDGLDVCHKCDNPGCVNPSHLFVGTEYDNMRDMRDKGRSTAGGSWNSKLTPEKVLEILNDTRFYKVIAEEYGVHLQTVFGIKKGKYWSAVTGRRV